jgi:hypothetical protein
MERWVGGRPFAAGGVGVAAAHDVAVPAEDRRGGDDQMELPQLGARQPVEC